MESWQAAARGESAPASSSVPVEVPGVFRPSPSEVDDAAGRMFGEGDRLDALGDRVYRR